MCVSRATGISTPSTRNTRRSLHNSLELEPRHDEGQIDFQTLVVGRFSQCLSLDDAIS